MSKAEYIRGNESVQDLMDMINRQDDPSGVMALICMTTRMRNPATFNQFTKRLKNEKPELYNKFSDLIGEEKNSTKFNNNNWVEKEDFYKIIVLLIVIALYTLYKYSY